MNSEELIPVMERIGKLMGQLNRTLEALSLTVDSLERRLSSLESEWDKCPSLPQLEMPSVRWIDNGEEKDLDVTTYESTLDLD